jgi:hypothetical protein
MSGTIVTKNTPSGKRSLLEKRFVPYRFTGRCYERMIWSAAAASYMECGGLPPLYGLRGLRSLRRKARASPRTPNPKNSQEDV